MELQEESRVISYGKTLLSTDGTNFIEVYSPGKIGSVELDGYITDLSLSVDIQSITELPAPTPPPEGTIAETETERNDRYYDSVRTHPAKYLGVYTTDPGSSEKKWRFTLPMWNSRPGYEDNLIEYLTNYSYSLLAYGASLWVRMEGAALGANDKLTLWVSGMEYKLLTSETYAINSATPSNKSVTTSSQIILPANENRKFVTITNRAGEICYLNYGMSAIAGAGIGLNAGGSTHNLKIQEINYRGAIAAVTASGTAQLEILEAV